MTNNGERGVIRLTVRVVAKSEGLNIFSYGETLLETAFFFNDSPSLVFYKDSLLLRINETRIYEPEFENL